jgi:hypothetical protein
MIDTMDALRTRFLDLFSTAWAEATLRFSDIVPEALLAIFVVLVGWVVATILQMIVLRILRFFAIDKLAGKTPLERLLKDIGVRRGLTDILGLLIFWLAILLTLTVAADMLRLTKVSEALAVVTSFIPQAIAALLIIVFGMLLARFLQVLTRQAFVRAEIAGDRVAGKIVYIVVFVFVALAAVEQLGIGLEFVTTNAIIMAAASLLLIGIAFIVGARTLIEGWMLTQYLRHEIAVDDRIEVGGVQGMVVRITQTAVILRVESKEVVIPSKHFAEKGYTRSRA